MPFDFAAIVEGMQAPDTETALSATVALQKMIEQEREAGRVDWESLVGPALPVLMEGLGHPYKGVQVHAATCLEMLSFQSAAVVPALRAAMAQPDAWKAWGAALVACRLGVWYPEMAEALLGALRAGDRDVRWAAAGYCLQLGRQFPEAVALLRAALVDGSPLARKMAAYTLGAVGWYAEVEADLAARLDDPERDVKRAAILAIDKLPRVSEPVQQRIAALRKDPDEYIRRTASAVAAKFGIA